MLSNNKRILIRHIGSVLQLFTTTKKIYWNQTDNTNNIDEIFKNKPISYQDEERVIPSFFVVERQSENVLIISLFSIKFSNTK